MPAIVYTVTATLPTPELAEAYVAWLRGGHVDQVIDAGAHSGIIVRLDPTLAEQEAGSRRVQTQYVFASRDALDHYVRHHAPALRADGLSRFGPETGVTFERIIGEIV